MLDWWNGLSYVSQIFAVIAIPATVIMLLQAILALIGVGIDHDVDFDGHLDATGDGLSLISIRGLVAFFSIGGWVGVVVDSKGFNIYLTSIIAFAAGSVALLGIAFIFKNIYKLQDSGNLDIENAVGKTGKVYIPVPPHGKGHGKINILVQDRYVELDAVSDGDKFLETHELVTVIKTLDADTVVVEKTNNNKSKIKGGISQWIKE